MATTPSSSLSRTGLCWKTAFIPSFLVHHFLLARISGLMLGAVVCVRTILLPPSQSVPSKANPVPPEICDQLPTATPGVIMLTKRLITHPLLQRVLPALSSVGRLIPCSAQLTLLPRYRCRPVRATIYHFSTVPSSRFSLGNRIFLSHCPR